MRFHPCWPYNPRHAVNAVAMAALHLLKDPSWGAPPLEQITQKQAVAWLVLCGINNAEGRVRYLKNYCMIDFEAKK